MGSEMGWDAGIPIAILLRIFSLSSMRMIYFFKHLLILFCKFILSYEITISSYVFKFIGIVSKYLLKIILTFPVLVGISSFLFLSFVFEEHFFGN